MGVKTLLLRRPDLDVIVNSLEQVLFFIRKALLVALCHVIYGGLSKLKCNPRQHDRSGVVLAVLNEEN